MGHLWSVTTHGLRGRGSYRRGLGQRNRAVCHRPRGGRRCRNHYSDGRGCGRPPRRVVDNSVCRDHDAGQTHEPGPPRSPPGASLMRHMCDVHRVGVNATGLPHAANLIIHGRDSTAAHRAAKGAQPPPRLTGPQPISPLFRITFRTGLFR